MVESTPSTTIDLTWNIVGSNSYIFTPPATRGPKSARPAAFVAGTSLCSSDGSMLGSTLPYLPHQVAHHEQVDPKRSATLPARVPNQLVYFERDERGRCNNRQVFRPTLRHPQADPFYRKQASVEKCNDPNQLQLRIV